MHGDIRDDWKINDLENKVNDIAGRMYEIDTLNRKLCSTIDGLRYELETCNEQIKLIVDVMEALEEKLLTKGERE